MRYQCPYCKKEINTDRPIIQLLKHIEMNLSNMKNWRERILKHHPESDAKLKGIKKWQSWYDALAELIEKNEPNP